MLYAAAANSPTDAMVSSNGTEKFLQAFEQRFARDRSADWLRRLRRSAIERFAALGFPTTRDEDWKYTSVAPIVQLDFDLANGGNGVGRISRLPSLMDGASNRMVFVDGVFRAEYSSTVDLPAGLQIRSLADVLAKDADSIAPWLGRYAAFTHHSFVALNTALMQDGAVVLVPEGCRVGQPLHILFAATASSRPRALQPRNLICCGAASEVKIVEIFEGNDEASYWANPVTEIVAAAGSVVDHYRLQIEGNHGFHVSTLAARLERDANLISHVVTLGGALVRNDIHALLGGEGAECSLNGLYLTGGEQHVDNHTEIDHEQPRASSRELYKGILGGRAHAVFNGKIIVRKDAQKSDARQTNKNLLLSKNAVIDSKPQLEIYANDVKCSHGSTIGQLDRDALFYLRSRGIDAAEAENLLSYAFAAEVLQRMKVAPLRAHLEEYLLTRFGRTAVRQ
jgi:Fe-S cluster assembly protein SufD